MPGPSQPIPILERIAQNLEDTLRAVTVNSGYPLDLTVERANPGVGNRDRNNLAVIVQGNPVRTDPQPLQHDEWDVPFQVICSAIEPEDSTVSVDTRLNRLWASVTFALCGTEDSRHRDGLAFDTIPADPDFGPTSTTAHEGEVTVNVTVRYRHLQGNPFSQ